MRLSYLLLLISLVIIINIKASGSVDSSDEELDPLEIVFEEFDVNNPAFINTFKSCRGIPQKDRNILTMELHKILSAKDKKEKGLQDAITVLEGKLKYRIGENLIIKISLLCAFLIGMMESGILPYPSEVYNKIKKSFKKKKRKAAKCA